MKLFKKLFKNLWTRFKLWRELYKAWRRKEVKLPDAGRGRCFVKKATLELVAVTVTRADGTVEEHLRKYKDG